MHRERPAEKKSFLRKIKSALAFRRKDTLPVLEKYKTKLSGDSLSIIQDYEAKYRDGRQMTETEAVRLAEKALCPLTYVEQVVKNHSMDAPIIQALLGVHKETKGSGAATVAAAKAATQAAKTHMPTTHIEKTLKSLSLVAHYTKSVEATAACAETVSLYEGEHAVDIAGMLFGIVLPYNYEYKEKPKDIVMRSAAFLRDKEVMEIVKGRPFFLEIAAYACSKTALEACIGLDIHSFLVWGMPRYVQLGISKVARATRLGEDVIRWINLIKNHIANGDVNARLMILLLCQFGTQAGDATPNHIDNVGIRDAAESGKKILGESHKAFFAEFSDCVL